MAYYTNVIFQNRKITFEETNIKYHRVIANDDIKQGELLFMEHLAHHQENHKIVSYVRCNKILFDTLYPRTEKKYTHEDRFLKEKEVGDLAVEKVAKNVFKLNHGKHNEFFAIGDKISKFNHHNTNPNCSLVITIETHKGSGKQLSVASLKANKNIKKGDELFIYYGQNMIFEGDEISISGGEKNYIEPTIDLNQMELKIAHQYMEKPMFHTIYDKLALADNCWIYHYDDSSLLIGSKNGKPNPKVILDGNKIILKD